MKIVLHMIVNIATTRFPSRVVLCSAMVSSSSRAYLFAFWMISNLEPTLMRLTLSDARHLYTQINIFPCFMQTYFPAMCEILVCYRHFQSLHRGYFWLERFYQADSTFCSKNCAFRIFFRRKPHVMWTVLFFFPLNAQIQSFGSVRALMAAHPRGHPVYYVQIFVDLSFLKSQGNTYRVKPKRRRNIKKPHINTSPRTTQMSRKESPMPTWVKARSGQTGELLLCLSTATLLRDMSSQHLLLKLGPSWRYFKESTVMELTIAVLIPLAWVLLGGCTFWWVRERGLVWKSLFIPFQLEQSTIKEFKLCKKCLSWTAFPQFSWLRRLERFFPLRIIWSMRSQISFQNWGVMCRAKCLNKKVFFFFLTY